MAIKDTQEGTKFWQKSDQGCPYNWCWYFQPLAIDVEMTAYALLTYTHRKDVVQCAQISKWLMAQRNSNGGFISTQDTVVALQALAEYATLIAGSGGGQALVVTLTAGTFSHTFETITSTNSLLLQSAQIPPDSTEVQVQATGVGVALVQLIVKYHVYNLAGAGNTRRKRSLSGSSSSYIQVHASQEQISDKEIQLTACASWTDTGPSGMVIMEIGMPTGYTTDNTDQLRGQGEGRVKNAEIDKTANELNIYLDELVASDTCVNVTLTKVLPVGNVQKARVTAYLYYNPAARSVYEYESLAEANKSYCDSCPACCACNPPDYFECGGTCFAASAKCNGTSECPDNSDEADCATTTSKAPVVVRNVVQQPVKKKHNKKKKHTKKMKKTKKRIVKRKQK
jgi:CD109 antigen